MKFIFNTASVERMSTAGIDYLSATDGTVGQYADQYYQYYSDGSGQVIANTVQGSGNGPITRLRQVGFTDGMNVWAYQQVEKQQDSDGNTTQTHDVLQFRGRRNARRRGCARTWSGAGHVQPL